MFGATKIDICYSMEAIALDGFHQQRLDSYTTRCLFVLHCLELEGLGDPTKKEVAEIRKKIEVVDRELKPLKQTCDRKEREYKEAVEAFNEKSRLKTELITSLMELSMGCLSTSIRKKLVAFFSNLDGHDQLMRPQSLHLARQCIEKCCFEAQACDVVSHDESACLWPAFHSRRKLEGLAAGPTIHHNSDIDLIEFEVQLYAPTLYEFLGLQHGMGDMH
eukprot:Gb_29824 [translate_table: standard]